MYVMYIKHCLLHNWFSEVSHSGIYNTLSPWNSEPLGRFPIRNGKRKAFSSACYSFIFSVYSSSDVSADPSDSLLRVFSAVAVSDWESKNN